jgi:hypothetical protein
MSNPNLANGQLATGDPIVPGFFRSFSRANGSKNGRRILIVAVVSLLVAIALGVGLVVFSSMSRQPQSYKDGFSAGGGVYASDGTAQLGARQACKASELLGPNHGGLPSGANASQWLQGCIAAFNSAQNGN